MKVDVSLNERVLVYVDGQPRQYLVPGRYRLWIAPWRKVEVKRLDTDKLVADLRAEDLALIPAEDLRVLSLGPYERALVSRRGKPARWIGPGQVQVWTAEREAIAVEIYQIPGVEAAPLRDEVKALVPNTDYVEATAADGFTVVRYVDGAIDAVLGPGRAAAWTAKRKVQLVCIELRERLLAVTGQEVMTRDRVSLRLNLTAGYRVADVRRLLTVARAADEVLYLAVQLASREAVATRAALKAAVAERAAAVGLQLLDLGLKDLVLPGEMKALLNRVIEAQKEAEANVILRREETAATRSMAQTAKVLAENPLLVRLKELEAYKELASKVGTVNLVLGESVLPQLQLKA